MICVMPFVVTIKRLCVQCWQARRAKSLPERGFCDHQPDGSIGAKDQTCAGLWCHADRRRVAVMTPIPIRATPPERVSQVITEGRLIVARNRSASRA